MDWLKPANAMLAVTLLAAAFVMIRAQSRADFDFAEMLKDENGKPSAFRLLVFGAFAASTWVLMLYGVADKMTDWMWWAYLAAWSGSAVLAKAVDAWKSK